MIFPFIIFHRRLGVDPVDAQRILEKHLAAILFRHALKNSLIPTVSILGVLVGRLFSGAIVAEIVPQSGGSR